jgi:outer membrane protein TolC
MKRSMALLVVAALGVHSVPVLAQGARRAPQAPARPPHASSAGIAGVPSDAGPVLALSLTQALALALNNNLAYRQAAADERVAQARLVQAASTRLPSLSAGYAYTHTQNSASFTFPVPTANGLRSESFPFSATDTNSVDAALQYALFTGGAAQANIGAAAAGVAAAQSQRSASRATVVRDTINAYFQLVQAQRAAVIAQQAAALAQQNETLARQLYSAGVAAKADVLRQDLSLANARLAAIQARNGAALANAALANLLNVGLGSRITATEPLEGSVPSYELAPLLSGAQLRRPEIAAARYAVAVAQSAVRAARAGYLPSVSLSIQDASVKPNFVNLPQPQLSETLAATWRLFDGGLTKGKVQEAAAQADKAGLSLQQLGNGVDLEVRQAYSNLAAAQSALDVARAAQTSAAENLRVSRIRFRAGAGTSLELADALLSDTGARTQYVNAQANLRAALANLQRAAGLL